MKLKLDVVNKWQEPLEEEETVKFWVLPDVDGTVDLGATLPDGSDVNIGYFTTRARGEDKISLSLWLLVSSQKYFNLDYHKHIETF